MSNPEQVHINTFRTQNALKKKKRTTTRLRTFKLNKPEYLNSSWDYKMQYLQIELKSSISR